MCGLLVSDQLSPIEFLDKLQMLRSRGADSSGIASFNLSVPHVIHKLHRDIRPDEIKNIDFGSRFLIGHYRWASESAVTIENTHPILSHDGKILLAHNGSLTNYDKIQYELEDIYRKNSEGGFSYEGKSDSVVLADFIERLTDYQLPYWKQQIDENFDGTYAIVFLVKGWDGVCFMTKNTPLYYYNGQLSSESQLFPKSWPIPNNSWGYISTISIESKWGNKQGYELLLNGAIVTNEDLQKLYIANIEFGNIKPLGIDPMLSEIEEQAALNYNYLEEIANFTTVSPYYTSLKLVGCGSSYNAALLGKKYFDLNPYALRVSVDYASEYSYNLKYLEHDRELKVAISQSGETADVLEVLRNWKTQTTTPRILITNKQNSSCQIESSGVYSIRSGTETAVAATKTFTATCVLLYALSSPKAYLDANLDGFKKGIKGVLNGSREISDIAQKLLNFRHFLVFGSGLNYAVAREVSLKIKEVSQIHAEAAPSGENKHGIIALSDNTGVAIFILPCETDSKYSRILNNAKQFQSRGGKLVGIGPSVVDSFDYFIQTPKDNQIFQPLINNVVGQLLAYYLALHRNIDPNNVRNCAKAITVH